MSDAPPTSAERFRRIFHIRNACYRNTLSEFFGTALLVFIGIGTVMQHILSHEKVNAFVQVNIGWGLALAFSAYTCMSTSGGHLNPAVSLAMVTLGNLKIKDFFFYCAAQMLGAFCAAFASFIIYYDQIDKFAGPYRTAIGNKATAGCFTSFPALHVSNWTCFVDQIAGTALLVLFICVVTDKRNKIPAAGQPLLIGLSLAMIGMSYGMNVGYPLNPARDFGPRLFAWFIYGKVVFTFHNWHFWIPIVAPLIGGPLGAWAYQFFVGVHIQDEREKMLMEEEKPLRENV